MSRAIGCIQSSIVNSSLVEDVLLIGGFVAVLVRRPWLRHFAQWRFETASVWMSAVSEQTGVAELPEEVADVELTFSVCLVGGLGELPVVEAWA